MRRTRRHLVVATLVGLLVTGCAAPAPAPSTSVPAASAGASGAALATPGAGPSNASPSDLTGPRSDLAYLVERLEVLHPNPVIE